MVENDRNMKSEGFDDISLDEMIKIMESVENNKKYNLNGKKHNPKLDINCKLKVSKEDITKNSVKAIKKDGITWKVVIPTNIKSGQKIVIVETISGKGKKFQNQYGNLNIIVIIKSKFLKLFYKSNKDKTRGNYKKYMKK